MAVKHRMTHTCTHAHGNTHTHAPTHIHTPLEVEQPNILFTDPLLLVHWPVKALFSFWLFLYPVHADGPPKLRSA